MAFRGIWILPACLVLMPLHSLLCAGSSSASTVDWNDLGSKRKALKSFRQEFQVSYVHKYSSGQQSSQASLVLDCSGERWRAKWSSGSGERIRVFNGQDFFDYEGGGDEFVRVKMPRNEAPASEPYDFTHLDFKKVTERGRASCGLSNSKDECVTVDIAEKPWINSVEGHQIKMMDGFVRLVIDTANGLMLSSQSIQNIDSGRAVYQSQTAYRLTRLTYNGDMDDSMFRVPTNAKEVKALSKWDAEKIKKVLAGKPAPEFVLTDLNGKSVRAADLKGKTVLLDFWATWCGPCRADGPSLDKLQQKYGGKSLQIIGISVDEDRKTVQDFLSEHPHAYSIALTTENSMPQAYQIGVFPTYVVIDGEGNLVSATEGTKGFSELRKMLKKAGLETD